MMRLRIRWCDEVATPGFVRAARGGIIRGGIADELEAKFRERVYAAAESHGVSLYRLASPSQGPRSNCDRAYSGWG